MGRSQDSITKGLPYGQLASDEVISGWGLDKPDPPPPPRSRSYDRPRPEVAKPTNRAPEPASNRNSLTDCWRSFSVAELMADPPQKEFVWEGRIPVGNVGSLAASGGMGKTSLLVGLAVHRAVGLPFLGARTLQGSTVIVTTEDSHHDYLRKLAAWRSVIPKLDLGAVGRRVHLVDLAGVPFHLIRAERGDYSPTSDVDRLAESIHAKCKGADLIILETVSRMGGDEGNPAMSALVCAAEQLSKGTGAAVLLVAHVSKAAGRDGIGDAYAARGGSAISDNGRFSLTLTGGAPKNLTPLLGREVAPGEAEDLVVLRVAKLNAARAPAPVVLRRTPTPWSMVLRVESAVNEAERHGVLRDRRSKAGGDLRELAERQSAAGEPLTESKLSRGLFREIPGLAKAGIAAAVLEATEDGFIHAVKRQGRGGGVALHPGPAPSGAAGPGGAGAVPGQFRGSSSDLVPSIQETTIPPKTEGTGELFSLPPPPLRPAMREVPPRDSSPGQFQRAGGAW